ncbi:MAG: DsbA family protein [Weeksellaceae bacterium]
MATAKASKPKKVADKDITTEEVVTSPTASTTIDPVMSMMKRLNQMVSLMMILLVALFLFQTYTFYKLKNLEKNGITAGATESPLSEENLIAYAEELDLDKKEFEQCLTDQETKSIIESDTKEAQALNVTGTPGFFVNGRFLGGAFPFEFFKEVIDKELAGTGSDLCTDYSEELQQYCSDPQNQAFNPVPQAVTVGNAPTQGPANAKVTIVEFSDFECPFCQRAFPTVEQILEAYPNDVKLAYKHLPLSNIHPNAQRAAEATMCADKQDKFWEMHDKLFTLGQ